MAVSQAGLTDDVSDSDAGIVEGENSPKVSVQYSR